MQTIQASEAEEQFPRILDDVERGDTVVIVRDGRPIARITPEVAADAEDLVSAVTAMRNLRKRIGRLTLEEILSARDEGRA
jgi:prevent-host-death family protein